MAKNRRGVLSERRECAGGRLHSNGAEVVFVSRLVPAFPERNELFRRFEAAGKGVGQQIVSRGA